VARGEPVELHKKSEPSDMRRARQARWPRGNHVIRQLGLTLHSWLDLLIRCVSWIAFVRK
jgi:hypothetical protein